MASTDRRQGNADGSAAAAGVGWAVGAAEAALIAAEMERCRAVSEGDFATLDTLLDESLTHTHMNGRVDSKPALLDNLRSRPRRLRRGELAVRRFGDCAVMTGPQQLDLGAGWVTNQATQTWVRRGGRWLLVAFHASSDDPTPRASQTPTRESI